MFDSPIINVAIGVILLFAVLSSMASATTEVIARYLGLRGAFLLTGLRSLVDGNPDAPQGSNQKPAIKAPGSGAGSTTDLTTSTSAWIPPPRAVPAHSDSADTSAKGGDAAQSRTVAAEPSVGSTLADLLATPVFSSLGTLREIHSTTLEPGRMRTAARSVGRRKAAPEGGPMKLSLAQKRALPSYVSSRTVAAGILDLLVPDASGETSMDDIWYGLTHMQDGPLKQQLLNLAKASTGRIDEFRKGIEAWYDDHMDRVSGWYKRYTRWITLAIGALAVVVLNIQILGYAQNLYTDQAFGQTVVTKALASAQCQDKQADQCLADARQQLRDLTPGLQIGWREPAACQPASSGCDFFEQHGFTGPALFGGSHSGLSSGLTLLVEWLVTVLALIPGSRFWFDLINQFSSLRSAGPKPASSTQRAT